MIVVARSGVGLACLALAAPAAAASSGAGDPFALGSLAAKGPRCAGVPATIVGKATRVRGTKHRDVIVVTRRAGSSVSAAGGNDLVCGGPGPDRLEGGTGNDVLRGNGGADTLVAGRGRDRLTGAEGVDRFTTRGSRAMTDLQAGEWLNGRRQVVVKKLRSNTVELPSRKVSGIAEGRGGETTVTVDRGVRAPRPGQILIVPAHDTGDRGALGRVTAVKGSRISLAPVALDRAYAKLQVDLHGTVGDLAAGGGSGQASAAAAGASLTQAFSCSGSVSKPVNVNVDLTHVELDATIDTNVFNPQIGMSMVSNNIPIKVSAGFGGSASCKPKNPPSIYIPIPYTPLGIDLTPAFEASASGSLTVDYATKAKLAYGFHRAKRGPNQDTRSFKLDSATPTINGQAKFGLKAGLSTSLSLSRRAGIGGTLGPKLDATVTGGAPTCASLSGGFFASLDAYADVFFSHWDFTLWKGEFGGAELWRRCQGPGASGNGTGSGGAGGGSVPGAGTPVGSPDDPSVAGPVAAAESVRAGSGHSCALLRTHAVSCWGSNYYGQIAAGGSQFSSTPVSVPGIRDATSLDVGGETSCVIRAAGRVACWGRNNDGELGNGTYANSSTPVPVTGLDDAVQVAPNGLWTCALRQTGTIACWGYGIYSQREEGKARPELQSPNVPTPLPGIANVVQISTGNPAVCARLASGRVSCWMGEDGWQGVPGLTDAIQLDVGQGHACAIRTTGQVVCWGENYDGQLGTGSNSIATLSTPALVYGIDSATEVSAGSGPLVFANGGTQQVYGAHSCARVRTGEISCWGFNKYGQLGDGSTSGSRRPVGVQGVNDADGLSAGSSHTCALRAAGTVACWGANGWGQLGDGSRVDRSNAVPGGGER